MTQATVERTNTFEVSLGLAFKLTNDETERVAGVMRTLTELRRDEVVIPHKMITPSTKGMTAEAKRQIFDEVDSVNSARTAKVRNFLARFLSDDVAELLASRLRPTVEGLVVLHCPGDEHFTLIVDHS